MQVNINRSTPAPLFEQVASDIRRAIAEGEIGPGERMPPAKDLATVLEVNNNTVLRSLRILRDEGILEFRRGRGIRVTNVALERSTVIEKAQEFVDLARYHGYRTDDIVALIERMS